MSVLQHEHEHKDSYRVAVFYPDHAPRHESNVFRQTKEQGHAKQLPCAISGQTEGVEYHHLFCEWAFSDAVDWATVKQVALGKVTRLPVLDLQTHQPTDRTYPVEHSLLYSLCKLAELRGFDWQQFNPDKPETFVDSMANMLVLHSKFHRQQNHGIHEMTFPEWLFQAMPRRADFVFTEDELVDQPVLESEEHHEQVA